MGKRVLIASMSVGGGHGRAGQCVAAAIQEAAPGWTVRTVDLRDCGAAWFRLLCVSGYLLLVRRLPWVWGFLYRHPPRRSGTLPPWAIRLGLRRYARLVDEFRPHAVLATQITASEATDRLRAAGRCGAVAATVVTDFDAHPSWRAERIARFFVPDEAIRGRFVAAGWPADRLEATGIPIDPAFERPGESQALRARHGVRPGAPAVVLMGGSLGLGSLERAVRQLLATGQPLDLLVVAGHNARLRRRLEALRPGGPARLHVFGFVDFVPELLALADLFVSKPGGLSMTEALTVGVPVLAVDPLPGQEEANLRHLVGHGVVRERERGQPLAEAVVGLLDDEAERGRLARAARAYVRRGAARRIAGRLIQMAEEQGD